MSLTETAIRNLRPLAKPRKCADSEGLFLFVSTSGAKSWRFRYRFLGKEQEITFGTYPALSLLEARTKKLEARKLLASGKDPLADKKETRRIAVYKATNTFQAVAKEWFDLNKSKWTAKYAQKVWNRFENYVFPKIGSKPIGEVSGLEILDEIIRKIEKNGNTETSHKLLQNCSAVFRLAFITKRVPYNPLADLRGILKPHKAKNLPTIKINELPKFLKQLQSCKTSELNKLAIKMLLLTFVRPGELRKAKWEYFDFKKKTWCIPAELMKMRKEHIVPLANQTIKLLHEIKTISGDSEYLFPTRNKIKHPYMNENVINDVIRSIGYQGKLVAHGFRSLASTTLNEFGFEPDVIEKQLAHSERNQVRAAYNRAEYLQERIKMMHWWAGHIDSITK